MADYERAFDAACASDDPRLVGRFIAAHASRLDAPDAQGDRCFAAACARGGLFLAAMLLERGADADARNAAGESGFDLACREGREAVVRQLVARPPREGAVGYGLEAADGSNAFMAACINNQYETLRILLEHPKRITPDQVNKKDRGGTTALMHACRLNLLEIVQELLSPEHPVDLNATDNEGRTAFWHACASGSEAVVRLMLNHQDRVEVNKPDARGVPPRDACSGVLRAVLLEEVVAQGFNRLKVDATRIVYNWRDDSTFLGEGGFGYVYRGHLVGPDGVSRTPAAVKVMIEHQSPELERLFLREVRIWAALEHKNIHRLLAFSLDPCLMASEIADGGDLVAYLFKQTCRRNLTLSKKGIPRLRPAPPPRRLPRPAPRPPQRHHPRRPHPQQRPHLFAPRKDHGLWHGPLPLPPRVLLEKQLRQGDRHVSAARGLRDGECGSAVPQGAERGRVRMGGDAVPGDRGGQAAVPRGGDGGSGQEQRDLRHALRGGAAGPAGGHPRRAVGADRGVLGLGSGQAAVQRGAAGEAAGDRRGRGAAEARGMRGR